MNPIGMTQNSRMKHSLLHCVISHWLWAAIALTALPSLQMAVGMPEVAPVDLAALEPADFTDAELDIPWHSGANQPMPYYLEHFHRLANAVVSEGENRGFIDLPVWRRSQDNRPYNARIMENILSLAYFYATDRPWNAYHGDVAVRKRLEAALAFWVNSQHVDGRFSEYGVNRWNLAATAFASKFMSGTLELLHNMEMDPTLMDKVWQSQRRAIMAVLDNESSYQHGMRFSNQFGNVWPAALMCLRENPDPEMASALRKRLESGKTDFQSPAGFFYEIHAPDWGYAFGTHFSNMISAWHYARNTEWQPYFEKEVARWAEWFSYNAYPEPGYGVFSLNRAIQSRQTRGFLQRLEVPMAETIPLMRAWSPTHEEIAMRQSAIRARLTDRWPHQDRLSLRNFSAFSPYAFLHRANYHWVPSEAEREAAWASLPFNARDHFTHQRVDSRNPLVYTYIKRPGYYVIFNSGEQIRERTRHGIGLLAHPTTGTVLQSHDDSPRLFWGTRASNAEIAYEAATLHARFHNATWKKTYSPEPGNRDLPKDFSVIYYPLGETGHKKLTFNDDAILVKIAHAGTFTEQLPLLVANKPEILPEARGLRVRVGEHVLLIEIDGAESITINDPVPGTVPIDGISGYLDSDLPWNNAQTLLNNKRPVLIEIHASGTLDYSISVVALELNRAVAD
jgi:hypothetical protein